MVVFPSAKLNLGLFVTGKRPDGFHALESVFVAVDWCDVLELSEGQTPGLTVEHSGLPIPASPPGSNLIERAYAALSDACGAAQWPVHAHLHKAIPMGAGLGGGSSDGAWMLRALNAYVDAGVPDAPLVELAAALGSDCPFFMQDGPAFVHGRGEHVEPVAAGSLAGWPVAVLHPGVHVSTRNAFAAVEVARPPFDLRQLPGTPVEQWHAAGVANAFQPGVAAEHPEVAAALALAAEGAVYTQLTGTGSAVFGLYPTDEQAMRVADRAKERGWAAWSGKL